MDLSELFVVMPRHDNIHAAGIKGGVGNGGEAAGLN
jgi:hypothetical protein